MKSCRLSFLSIASVLAGLGFYGLSAGTPYHVATTGSDAYAGSSAQPFLTIQKAATIMQPGDTCYVHAGTYREWVQPARSGTSESQRIVYRAASGEQVFIKGSNRVTAWTQVSGNVWNATFPDSYWGSLNPYTTNVGGEWFTYGGQYHLGEVYFNGEPYWEVTALTGVSSTAKTWYAEKAGTTTTITANFGGGNPNTGLAEINVRQSVFAPVVINIKYITVDGFTMSHAACQWSPPASNQQGLLSTYHGARWIIQNCHITDAKCVGLQNGSQGNYAGVNYANDGHSIARNNIIERCGQAGINGWAEWTAGLIEGNLIQDINYQRHFGGYETGGIKIHSSVDVTIRNNVIRRVGAGTMNGAAHYGIWLDWANQGTRITGNVIYEIDQTVIYHEMDHGPQLIDNNVFVASSSGSIMEDRSEYSFFVHNLFVNGGFAFATSDSRSSAYYTPHTTNGAGSKTQSLAGDKFYNNIHIQRGTSDIVNASAFACDYNVLYQGAQKSSWGDAHSIVSSGFNAGFQITSLPNGVEVSFNANTAPLDVQCPLITRSFLGVVPTTNQGIENPDGSAITIDKDLFGNTRNATHPMAGPFENLSSGVNSYRLIVGPEYTPNQADTSGFTAGMLSASPSYVVNTVATTVTFSIHAKSTKGSITGVFVDLSSLGAGSAVAMTNTSGTDLYSTTLTIPQGFALGPKTVTATVADNLGHQKTSSAIVQVAGSTSYTIIYTDADNKVTGTWIGDGAGNVSTLNEISTGASEGTKCYDMSYTVGAWWAGGGIKFAAMDFSSQDSLIFSFKGPGNNLRIEVGLGFSDNTGTSTGYSINSSSAYTRAAIPLSFFQGVYPMNSVIGINFIVVGVQSGASGHLYIDDIRLAGNGGGMPTISFVKGLAPNLRFNVACKGRALLITGAQKCTMQIMNLKGDVVANVLPSSAGNASFTLPASGAYLISGLYGTDKVFKRIIAW